MAAARRYYVVVIRDSLTEPWQIHFGDYSRSVALQEMQDWRDSEEKPAKRCKLITVNNDGTQATIDAAVAALNAGT